MLPYNIIVCSHFFTQPNPTVSQQWLLFARTSPMQLMYLEPFSVITQLNAITVTCETHATHTTQLKEFMQLVQVVVTSESARAIDQLRRACEGHGLMASSNLSCKGFFFPKNYLDSFHRTKYSICMIWSKNTHPCLVSLGW